MNFSRKMDELCHSLSLSQARIFDRSVEEGIPSFFFIKSFMLSEEARALDELNLESSGITETEIFDTIKNNVLTKRGDILPYSVIHFIGYFYRSAAYMLNSSSRSLYQDILPKFLVDNYPTLHSLPIEEAIKEALEANNVKQKSKEEIFFEVYKTL